MMAFVPKLEEVWWERAACPGWVSEGGDTVYERVNTGRAGSLPELGVGYLLSLTRLWTQSRPCQPRERVYSVCLRMQTGGGELRCTPGQSMWTQRGSQDQSRASSPLPRPGASTSVATGARARGSLVRGLGAWPTRPLGRQGTTLPPPPTSVPVSAPLTPLQSHGFPQGRHLLPLPADPQEVTTKGLRWRGGA